ncbi:alpha/beta hydrolase [Streptomyces chartreusis]|uniref:alpha/beta hydrolase n=1 Tax=Streptomyces chartreusis TaxID=1969 RepID=UPI0037141C9A
MTYAIDGELTPVLSLLPAIDLRDAETARDTERAILSDLPTPPIHDINFEDRHVPGPDAAPDVSVRIYRPRQASGALPGILKIHGGGFVTGGLDTDHAAAAVLASSLEAVVVSVDYRLAPEHPYPAAAEDCYAVLNWLAASTDELAIDPTRTAVHGESAGGGLAAAVTLMARDRSGPQLAFQFLSIPELDDRLETPSMLAYTDTPVWNRRNAEASWSAYLGGKAGSADVSAYAAPARADDLTSLPPAYVSVCHFDPLRDEGIEYARRLAHANVPVDLHLYPGTFHGSAFVTSAAVSRRMHEDMLAAFQRALTAH